MFWMLGGLPRHSQPQVFVLSYLKRRARISYCFELWARKADSSNLPKVREIGYHNGHRSTQSERMDCHSTSRHTPLNALLLEVSQHGRCLSIQVFLQSNGQPCQPLPYRQ